MNKNYCLLIIGTAILLLLAYSLYAQTPPNNCTSGQFVNSMLANTGQTCGTTPAQVNADWNAVSGAAQILNEPTSLPPSGAAGGSLAGTYPNPTLIARSFNNAPSHTIQTVAAAANGFQLSTTRDAETFYSVLITVTASIASGQSGYVVLEICPTNSAVAANWLEIGRVSSSQVYTLAVALQGVQGAGAAMGGLVPAGYFARLRSVNVTGTPTFAYVSGQEVLLP